MVFESNKKGQLLHNHSTNLTRFDQKSAVASSKRVLQYRTLRAALGSFVMVVTTPKPVRNSLNPSVYLAQDNSEIRYKLLMFSQEGAARAANGSSYP